MERRSHRDMVAELDLRQEMDWRQRSRQLWLAAWDANTRFFHQIASRRRRQNFSQQTSKTELYTTASDWGSSDCGPSIRGASFG